MSKIAIATDSNSGITPEQAKELGVYVIPMPFMMNGNTYFENVNLTVSEFFEIMDTNAEIKTSQPTPDSVMTLWDQLLKEYDEVVFIPMSSGLSGTCQTATMLSLDYDDRVKVVNNQRISVTLKQSVMDALELAKRGKSAADIKDVLENDRFNSSIYIMLDTLEYLKKGGRITPAAAALGTILRLKPILQIQGEKLDAFAKARTTAQGRSIMINAIKSDIENRFGGVAHKDFSLYIAHTQNESAAISLRDDILTIFPDLNVNVDTLSLSVACHIGPGALGIACCRKLHYDEV